nr:MAG TPA: hypothetical protein [Bacteriophage sp.]
MGTSHLSEYSPIESILCELRHLNLEGRRMEVSVVGVFRELGYEIEKLSEGHRISDIDSIESVCFVFIPNKDIYIVVHRYQRRYTNMGIKRFWLRSLLNFT